MSSVDPGVRRAQRPLSGRSPQLRMISHGAPLGAEKGGLGGPLPPPFWTNNRKD